MNGIEKDLEGKAEVIRVNLNAAMGKEIARRFDVRSAATTLLLDPKGKEIYRHTGMPNRKKIVEMVHAC